MDVSLWCPHPQVCREWFQAGEIAAHKHQALRALLQPDAGAVLRNGGGGADDDNRF
jgi:hypothetical protein